MNINFINTKVERSDYLKIYIAHSKNIDYINNLYKPLKEDVFLKKQDLIFPHEKSKDSSNTREFYKNIDLFIADCSEPATGLGIELGWAYDDNKKIYCIYQAGKSISSSINIVTNNIYEYNNIYEMVEVVKEIVGKETKNLIK